MHRSARPLPAGAWKVRRGGGRDLASVDVKLSSLLCARVRRNLCETLPCKRVWGQGSSSPPHCRAVPRRAFLKVTLPHHDPGELHSCPTVVGKFVRETTVGPYLTKVGRCGPTLGQCWLKLTKIGLGHLARMPEGSIACSAPANCGTNTRCGPCGLTAPIARRPRPQRRLDSLIAVFGRDRAEWWVHITEAQKKHGGSSDEFVRHTASPTRWDIEARKSLKNWPGLHRSQP